MDPFRHRNRDEIIHPLLQYTILEAIMNHIYDYPTLIILSKTCHAFRDFVYSRPKLLEEAFKKLEHYRSDDEDRRPHIEHLWSVKKVLYCTSKPGVRHGRKLGMKYCDCIYGHDILRFNCGQLRSLEWTPCYGCNQIKRLTTNFFTCRRQPGFMLLRESAQDRRCVTCSIAKPRPGMFQKPDNFLNHLPRGITGFRLRCSRCKNIEWVLERPRKKQRKLQLCNSCFLDRPEPLQLSEPEQLFLDEWTRLLNIQTEAAGKGAPGKRNTRRKGRRKLQPGLELPVRRRIGFEALSVED